ncbi:MAG: 50S ribosomal protein L10 [Alphaproteobacteria bacterium]|nr:50S ribosomal protein L10 [Alphaproteobacteria bacterium]
MDRSRKEELVAELKQQFSEAKLVVLAQHSKLGMSEINDLRQEVRDAGATFKVIKNTLAKLAVEGSDFAYLAEHFVGQTALAFSKDEVSAAKVLHNFSKKNDKVAIIAGGMADRPMTVAEVLILAILPSLDELRAKLVEVLQAPATKLAGVTQAPAGQLARVFGAYAKA